MKLTTGLQQIAARDVEKGISKKILNANTADKITDKKDPKLKELVDKLNNE